VYPKTLGAFQCATKFVVPNSGPVLQATLNAQGYSTKYVTPSTIYPQTSGSSGSTTTTKS